MTLILGKNFRHRVHCPREVQLLSARMKTSAKLERFFRKTVQLQVRSVVKIEVECVFMLKYPGRALAMGIELKVKT